ncbi:MAG: PQQ-dependent sugar dehydrogenase [Clostridiales bacterium]|nr:PQQ-dependent sugar dehydrogenase [Clostridiales bacterium]
MLMPSLLLLGIAESLPPVEDRHPFSSYQPAFPGQTRAPGMKTLAPYHVSVLTEDLSQPWAVSVLPDGRLIISEKRGSMRIFSQESGLSSPIYGFLDVAYNGQGGLLDLVPAPDFQTSRQLYFSFARPVKDGSVTALGRVALSADEGSLMNAELLFEALPAVQSSGHFGSRIAFVDNDTLFLSTGDRQHDYTRKYAQDFGSGIGKILRMDRDGNPLFDNPFINDSGAMPQVYSMGHRNVQGLAIHPVSRALYAGEMGPLGGDEINLIMPGRNYGWPVITYGLEYSHAPVGEGLTQMEGMEQPLYYWDPTPAISGMDFYTGNAIPEWQNNLFIGGLAGSHVMRLRIEDGKVTGEERLLADQGQRFRDVAASADGSIYFVTDEGRLYQLRPGQ